MKCLLPIWLACLLATGCALPAAKAPTPPEDAARIAQEESDVYWAGTEANIWLSSPGHSGLKVSDKTVKTISDDAYGAGASEVRIGKPIKSVMGADVSSGSIIIKLPAVQKTRQKVFEVINKYWGQSGRATVDDTGQDFEGLNVP